MSLVRMSKEPCTNVVLISTTALTTNGGRPAWDKPGAKLCLRDDRVAESLAEEFRHDGGLVGAVHDGRSRPVVDRAGVSVPEEHSSSGGGQILPLETYATRSSPKPASTFMPRDVWISSAIDSA